MEPVSRWKSSQIWRGSFPGGHGEHRKNTGNVLSILSANLSFRDVRTLTQVADEHRFYVFLKAVAARTGQMLNYCTARDAEISQPTAKSYLSILETSGLVKLLYPI